MPRRAFSRWSGAVRRAAFVSCAIAAVTAGPGPVVATPQDQQALLAAAGAIKIAVRGHGWVRVGQPQLVAAGLDPRVDPATLQLFADGLERSIGVTGNGDARFTGDESIEFYGVGRDTLSADTRTYWLIAGVSGARVPLQAAPAGGAAPSSFLHVERLLDRKVYLSAIRNGEESNFFAAAVSATPANIVVRARHLDPARAAEASLRVTLQGVTATAHVVDVTLNGRLLGSAALDGQEGDTFTFPAPDAVDGNNAITLVGRASAADYSALASVELEYAHAYAADDDTLSMTAPAGARLAVAGFSTSDVRIVDVTDETHPIELAVAVTTGGGAYDARVDVPAGGGTHELYAFTTARIGAPASVAMDAPSSWGTPRDGELVILSPAAFLDAVAPLAARRAQEGWSVQLVDLQDVYDELGYGDKSPDAIRAFLQRARAGWRVPPRFVLLVGDATFDPRNFLGRGDFDFTPTKLIDTATMETASDDWFGDADLDGVPELAIGRLPVRTAGQAAVVVQKTLAYRGTAELARGGLFVTDTDGPELDFSAASATAETKVSDIMPVDRFQRGQPGTTTDALLAKLNTGPFLVNYIGHGSVEVWDGLLTSAQAAGLTNAHPSIYVVMNCLNGFFQDLYTTSLAEALLGAPQGGAVAVWASSTLAEYAPQPVYNQELLMRLGRMSLGESALAAKQAITNLESRKTWMLFGDPTLLGAPRTPTGPDAGADAGQAADGGAGTDAGGTTDGGASTDAGASMDADAAGNADAGEGADAAASDAEAGGPDAGGPAPDAGATADAASGTDGPPASDAGTDPLSPRDGCSCSTGGGSAAGGPLTVLLLAGVATARTRRLARARRGRRALLGLLVLALAWLGGASNADAAYTYRRSITINRNRVGNTGAPTTLSNYPLLLDLSDPTLRTVANSGHVRNASGYDINFFATDTTTCGGPSSCTFAYEIESYDAVNGRVIAWVRIPALNTVSASSDTVIYVQYGDMGISSPTQNVNGTWDSNFRAIWHLNQSPGGSAPQMTNSTSTAAHASSAGSPTPATATGQIGSGVSTSGTTGTGYFDYRSASFNWTASDTFTYSGWFKTTDAYGPVLSQRDNGAGSPVIDITVGYDGSSTSSGNFLVLVRDDTGGTFAEVVGSTAVNNGNWHLFTVTRSGGSIEVYLDGSSTGTGMGAGAASTITTGASGSYQNIGREGNWVQSNYGTVDQRYLAGTFDEYRISATIRTSHWIKTDYNTQSAPGSTFTLGGELSAFCGDGTVGSGEVCDDGNFLSGDGCSTACTVESGYSCVGTTPSVCSPVCGDNVVITPEACDDGGTANGDGCSSSCTVEPAYHCSGSPSTCVLASFDYYRWITVDRTRVGTASAPATLSNYPVLISVTDPNLRTIANGGHMRSSNGYDLIFRGNSLNCGGPVHCTFAHEIEKYDPTTGELVAWVKIPVLNTQTATANTLFEILYGNRAISTSTEQPTSTWDSNFMAVWHLHQNPSGAAPQMSDSSSNVNHGTATGVTTASAGRAGAGVTMDGSTSFIAVNSGTSLNTAASGAFTYSGWIRTSDSYGGLFSLRSSTDGGNAVIDIMVGRDGASTNANRLMALLRDSSNAGQADLVSATSIADNTWHYVTLTHSGTSMQLYLDTTSVGTATVSSGAYTTNLRNIGREGRWVQDSYTTVAEEYLSGTFDEFRASNAVRSLDWITTDYNNQSSPSTFSAYMGAELAAGPTTDAVLSAFHATETCGGTIVEWQTTYEIDTLGFNVFRQDAGARVQLNAALIPAAGTGGSHRYELFDDGPIGVGRGYSIERVRFSLQSSWHGPVAPAAVCDAGAVVPGTNGRPASTPLATDRGRPPGLSSPEGAPDEAAGCAMAPRAEGSSGVAVFALVALALARRRRRRVG